MKFTFQPESTPLDGFTIKRAIHRGGFGEVYYALSDAGKEVALKLLQHNLEVELRGVSQCLNLKHPNLVTIFDIRTDDDGDHWIVMEYVSGKGLDQVLAEQSGEMSIDDVRHWLTGIGEGLAFLHDRGIVHRDLKPANIFRENGVVKIGDVGLSKLISESRRSAQTQSVGTVYYMAPEVAHGRYGREVDVYSLGIILYELLTGDVPFNGESTAEILMKHLSEKPNLEPIPKRLRPVLQRVLEKDPLKRTPSATQLIADFDRAVAGFDVGTEHPAAAPVVAAAPVFAAVPVSSGPASRTTTDNDDDIDDIFDDDDDDLDDDPTLSHAIEDLKNLGRDQAKNIAHHLRREARRAARHARSQEHKAAYYARKLGRKAARFADKQRANAAKRERKQARTMGAATRSRPPGNAQSATAQDAGFLGRTPLWAKVAIAVLLLIVFSRMGSSRMMRPDNVLRMVFVLGFYGAIGYGIFRGIGYIRSSVGGHGHGPTSSGTRPISNDPPLHAQTVPPVASQNAQTVGAATAQPAAYFRRTHKRRYPVGRTVTRTASTRTKITELTGSMTAATFFSVVITLALALTGFLDSLGVMSLFGLTTLLGAWAVMAPSKLWEETDVKKGNRRMTLLALGAAVGMAAFCIDEALLVNLPEGVNRHNVVFSEIGSHRLVTGTGRIGQPTMLAYTIFFAALLGLRGWWRHADAMRSKRLRIISVLLTAGLAFGVSLIWAFPNMWGVTVAVAISSVVQLSSVWISPEERVRNMEAANCE